MSQSKVEFAPDVILRKDLDVIDENLRNIIARLEKLERFVGIIGKGDEDDAAEHLQDKYLKE